MVATRSCGIRKGELSLHVPLPQQTRHTTPLMGRGKSCGRGGGGGRGGGKEGASSSVSTSGDTPVCKTDRIAEAQAQELDSLAELFGDALVLRGDPPQNKGDKCGHFAVTVKRGELIGDNDDDENGTKNEIKLVILHYSLVFLRHPSRILFSPEKRFL